MAQDCRDRNLQERNFEGLDWIYITVINKRPNAGFPKTRELFVTQNNPPHLFNPRVNFRNLEAYRAHIASSTPLEMGRRWRSLLRHCAKSWKVAGSILDGLNPSGRTMALVSTQPITEMSTRNISWGRIKAAGA
jgi:hypothetical protein